MAPLWAKALAKVLDIDLNEPETDDVVEVTYATESDFQDSDIIDEDGSHVKINVKELERRTEEDIFRVGERAAPRCYRCQRTVPPPDFIWKKRLYCKDCLVRRDVLIGELHPGVLKLEYEVGIVVMKDGSRFPFLWNYDGDTLREFKRARQKGDLATFYDIEGGEVHVLPFDVAAIKKPQDLIFYEYEEPRYKKPKITYKVKG